MSQTENNKIETNTDKKDNEISLLSLIGVLWHYKWLIIIPTFLAAVTIVVLSVISLKLPPEKSFNPNVYTPKTEMLINDSSSSGGLSAAINASGLGSLAALAGYSGGSSGPSNSALAGYLLYSNTTLDDIIEHFNLIEKWNIEKSPIATSREKLKNNLKSEYSGGTGIFTIEYTDINPQFAVDVVNYATSLLEKRFAELGVDKNKLSYANLEDTINIAYNNFLQIQKEIQDLEYSANNGVYTKDGLSIVTQTALKRMELEVQQQIYTSSKAQLETLKIQMASEQPVFQVLEYAEIPDIKSGPSRGKKCIIVTLATGFITVFLAFAFNTIKNIRKDPEAIKQLKGENL